MPDICRMKIVITSATANEWREINNNINPLYIAESHPFQVSFHKSGVGTLLTAYSLAKLITEHKPNLIIQAGIAGTFDTTFELGEVIVVKDEYLGDVGVEENGKFNDIFDLELENNNQFPFENKKLSNPWLNKFNPLKLPEVTAVTINEVSTKTERIQQLKHKFGAVIESMEGAALHYVCLQTSTPFIQIRSISNYVGERDKSKWQIKKSLDNLSSTVLNYIEQLAINEIEVLNAQG